MSTINIHNYEEYMIDYMEGNLSPSLLKEMKEFLALNPEIKEELDGLDEVILLKEDISFKAKESLYKDIDASIFEDKCISYIENDLNKEEINRYELEVSLDDGKKSLLNDYKKTILVADNSIVFKNRENLKRHFPYRLKKLIHFSSAAAVIFAISMSTLIIPSEIVGTQQMSKNTEVFNMPKEDIPQEIINNPEEAFKESVAQVKVEKPIKKKKNIASPKPVIKKIEVERIPVGLTTSTIHNIAIAHKIKLVNTISNEEIIIREKVTISEKVIRDMSNELALNNNASQWKEKKEINSTKDKKRGISSNNIFSGGQRKLKTFLGKYFYKREITHSKKDQSTEK